MPNWVVDIATRCLGVSQNQLSRIIFTDYQNIASLGDPVSHIAPNTARFQGLDDQSKSAYIDDLVGSVQHVKEERMINWDSIDAESISEALLSLRILGAMRLRKLDTLPLLAKSIASPWCLKIEKVGVSSILSDLAEEPAVGRFEFFEISSNSDDLPRVLINFIATEGNPKDKAKEWGARRIATLYQYSSEGIEKSIYQHAVFVLDGIWAQSDITRLYRSGWDHIVRMSDLENILREIFGLNEN